MTSEQIDKIVTEFFKRFDSAMSTASSAAGMGWEESVKYVAVSAACYGAVCALLSIATIKITLWSMKGVKEAKVEDVTIAYGAVVFFAAAASIAMLFAAAHNLSIALAPKGYLIFEVVTAVAGK